MARYIAGILTVVVLWMAALTGGNPVGHQVNDATSPAVTGVTGPIGLQAIANSATTSVEALPAIESYERYNQRSGRYFMGWLFTVDEAKTISQLGAHDANRNGRLDNVGPTAVALFDKETEQLLASVQVPEDTEPEGGFAYQALDRPVTVIPGRTYIVASEVSGEPYAYGGATAYAEGINYVGYAYKVETVPTFPTHYGTGGNNYYGATFRVDSVTTPVVDNPGNQVSPIDTELSLDLTVKGPEGATLTWTAVGLPLGLDIDGQTGRITGSVDSEGTRNVSVTVTSDEGTSSSTDFIWSALDSQAPIIEDLDRTLILQGDEVAIQIEATDDDGALTYVAEGLPEGLAVDAETGLIAGAAREAGSYAISVTATDTLGLSSGTTFDLAVMAIGTSPAIESYENYTVRNGEYFMGWQFTVDSEMTVSQLGVHDSDRDGKLENVGSTTVALFDLDAGEVLGRAEVSRYAKTEAGFAYAKLHEPVVIGPGSIYIVAAEISGESYAFGGDISYGDDINFMGYAYKVGSNFGWPNRLGAGASNYFGATFRVESVPGPSLAPIDDQASPLGEPVTLDPVLETVDGGRSVWSATGLPSGLTIDDETGHISGTPDTIGTSTVEITIINELNLAGQVAFTWSVLGEFAPTIAPIADVTVVESDPISIQVQSDVVGPTPYAATGLPAGVTIDPTTGLLSGQAAPDGVYDITVTATDGLDRSDSTTFRLTILNWGATPAITTYVDYLARTGHYYMGWQFTVDETMTVSDLGVHDANRDGKISNRGPTTAGLYNKSTGQPIAIIDVAADAPVEDGFAYGPLDQPVVLEPGTIYIVAAEVSGEPYAYSGVIEFGDSVDYVGYAYRSGSEEGWPNYQGTSGPYYFGATFRTSEPRPVIP